MEKYSTNPELDRQADAVVEFCKRLHRGDTLTHENVERITGTLRYEGLWTSLVQKFRKRILDERNIALRPLNGLGYRFMTEPEQVDWTSIHRRKRARRQINRMIREVDAVPNGELTIHQQQRKARSIQDAKRERLQISRGTRNFTEEVRKSDALPRRNGKVTVTAE